MYCLNIVFLSVVRYERVQWARYLKRQQFTCDIFIIILITFIHKSQHVSAAVVDKHVVKTTGFAIGIKIFLLHESYVYVN
jgi:hypothetical protein